MQFFISTVTMVLSVQGENPPLRGGLSRCTAKQPSVNRGDAPMKVEIDMDGLATEITDIEQIEKYYGLRSGSDTASTVTFDDIEKPNTRGVVDPAEEVVTFGPKVTPTFRLPLTAQILPSKKVGGTPKKARYASIMLGTPRREFKVLLDTGSAHLIIPGWNCESEACKMHKKFKRSASATAVDINVDGSPATKYNRDQMSVSFGRGEVTGSLVSDEICIPLDGIHTGNHATMLESDSHKLSKASEFCVPLHFLTADEMSDEPFTRFEFDGVLGMSLKGLSQTPKFNFPHMLATGHFILDDEVRSTLPASDHVKNVFAVYLAKDDLRSEVQFGGWDSELLQSEISWTPVARPHLGYWTTKITNIFANGVALPLCQEQECFAVFDSGTSGLAAPGEAVTFLKEQLDHHFQAAYDPVVGDCNTAGDDMILEVELESDSKLVFSANDLATPKTVINNVTEACQASIFQINMPPPLGPNIFILGEPVLKKYYTIFDVENERVGTALFQDKPLA